MDEYLQTSNPHVFAAGDVIGDPQFVYVATYAGGLAAENALTGAGRVYDLTAVPRVTFTDPQVASVGYTEAQARELGHDVKTATLSLRDVPRVIAARDTADSYPPGLLASGTGEPVRAAFLRRQGLRRFSCEVGGLI